MATARGIDPFLKADLLTRTSKRHGQSLHRHAPWFPPYDTGVGSHTSCELTRNTNKANRRTRRVAEPPELFQLKCLSHASGAATHLNRNNQLVL
jgi:hypothetical protein